MKIPTHLKHQPIVDMVFELRFSTSAQVSEVLLGLLYHTLQCQGPIDALPPSSIPKEVRKQDPNLYYAVLNTFRWDDYIIGISDHGIILSMFGEYKGWTKFKTALIKLIEKLKSFGFMNNFLRYSIKYIDLFEQKNDEVMLKKLNFNLSVAGESAENNVVNARIERNIENHINVINVISHATVQTNNNAISRNGMILDIDSIRNIDTPTMLDEFISNPEPYIQEIHRINYELFIHCLTEETLKELGAEYNA